MIFKIPDALSLLFMQFYRRIERLNDILIYLPKFKPCVTATASASSACSSVSIAPLDQQDFNLLLRNNSISVILPIKSRLNCDVTK